MSEELQKFLEGNPTKEEVQNKIHELEHKARVYKNTEQGIKIGILNSIYGAFGNNHFRFFDVNIATSITVQAKDTILYAEKRINEYFLEKWHTDYELHKKLGITKVQKIDKPVVIYIDTDSVFLNYEDVFNKTEGFKGSITDFIVLINDLHVDQYVKEFHKDFSEENNLNNYLDLELEYIAKRGFFIAKKNYLMDISWKDGKGIEKNDKLYIKGFDTVKGSTPTWVRPRLESLAKFIVESDNDDSLVSDLAKMLTEMRTQYKYCSIEEISQTIRVNDYEKWILNDKSQITWESGTPYNIKAAAIHNHLLLNSKYTDKYETIKSGEKIKIYSTSNKSYEYFGFKSGKFPKEIKPIQINYDAQFYKTVIEPINRMLTAMGKPVLSTNLMFTSSLF